MDTPKQMPEPNAPSRPTEEYLYDATLIQLDELRGILIFKVDETVHRITYPHLSSFSVGAIGRLRLSTPNREFAFNAYPDQRLRRVPALDQPLDRRWGWCIGERKFTVEAEIIPGRAGKVIRRDTKPATLEIPSEFESFCKSRGVAPHLILSTFIADVCGLTNLYGCPREDGYCSSGEESNQRALAYINHTWSVDERFSLRESRHGDKGSAKKTR